MLLLGSMAVVAHLRMRLEPEGLVQSSEGVVLLPGVMTFSAFLGGGIGPEDWGSITEISLLFFWCPWSLPWLRLYWLCSLKALCLYWLCSFQECALLLAMASSALAEAVLE